MAATTAIESVASIVSEPVSLVNVLFTFSKSGISGWDWPRKVGMPFCC